MINLTRIPLIVKLNWNAHSVRIRDLQTGCVFSDSVTLQPRQVILGTHSVEAGKSVTEGQAELILSEPVFQHSPFQQSHVSMNVEFPDYTIKD